MKIIGNDENTNVIMLIHNGRNIKLQCVTRLMPVSLELEKDKEVTIVFDDLLEVDELISVLERFREECSGYIGSWQRQ